MHTPNRTLKAFLPATLAVGLLAAGATFARPPKNPEEQAQRFAQRMERVDKMVRNKLAPELGTDEATTNKLVEIFQAQLAAKHTQHQALRAEMQKLKKLVDDGAGDAALDTQLARIDRLRSEMPERGAVLRETARILTPTQQAKLVLQAPKMMGHHGKRGMHGKHGKRGKRGGGGGGFGADDTEL